MIEIGILKQFDNERPAIKIGDSVFVMQKNPVFVGKEKMEGIKQDMRYFIDDLYKNHVPFTLSMEIKNFLEI